MQLSLCYLFQGLSESQLNSLIAIGTEIRILKGQWLFRENRPAEHIFILENGAVELVNTVDDGVELPIAIKRLPGSCFGTTALIPPYLYSLSARGVEDGSLLAIKQADIQNLIDKDRELGFTIMNNLAKHFLERLKETRQELKLHFKILFKSVHS
jgi:CRP/FNR family transcriptional regulator